MQLAFYVIYRGKFSFFESDRVLRKPWIWESDPQKWRAMRWDIARRLFVNNLVLYPLAAYGKSRIRVDYKFDEASFPSFPTMLAQIFVLMLCDDIVFYTSHRTLHIPYFYKRIHKIHHEHSHSFSLSSEYTHPIEYVLGNLIPPFAGFLVLREHNVHFATVLCWVIFRSKQLAIGSPLSVSLISVRRSAQIRAHILPLTSSSVHSRQESKQFVLGARVSF